MIIKSLSGSTIIETEHKTIKSTLEYCAAAKISLERADLRRCRLTGANLDGLQAPSASFWGADLGSSDIGFADLQGVDLRNANLKDSCLAESNLKKADMRGAYFSSTLIEGAALDRAQISCPSFWGCDLQAAASLTGLTFWHRGEDALDLSVIPVVIHGLKNILVIGQDFCLWGQDLYPQGPLPQETQKNLFNLKASIEKILRGHDLRNAKLSIPKIRDYERGF